MEDMEFPDNMDDFVTLDELDNTAGDSLGRNCSLSIYNCVCVDNCFCGLLLLLLIDLCFFLLIESSEPKVSIKITSNPIYSLVAS